MTFEQALENAGFAFDTIRTTIVTVRRFLEEGYKPTKRGIDEFIYSLDERIAQSTIRQYKNRLKHYHFYLQNGYVQPSDNDACRRRALLQAQPQMIKPKAPAKYYDYIWGKPATYMDSHSVMWR